MPILSGPSRVLLGGVHEVQSDQLAQNRGAQAFNGITEETIESVTANGLYTITGRSELLATSGVQKVLEVGDIVNVAWKAGVPVVILAHSARRAKHGPPLGVAATGIVEELFSVNNNAIWFRNADQFAPILSNAADGHVLVPDDLGLDVFGVVHWGHGTASAFCVEGSRSGKTVWAVATINRPVANEPFPKGTKVRATLVRTYNMTDDATTYGSYSGTVSPGIHTASASIKLIQPSLFIDGAPDTPAQLTIDPITPVFAALAPNLDLLVTIKITADSSGVATTTTAFRLGSMLINVTKGIVLVNRLSSGFSTNVFVSSTPAASPTCTVIGAVAVNSVTTGAPASVNEAGEIALLSTKIITDSLLGPVGTFNNYALVSPAVFQGGETFLIPGPGSIFCYSPRANLQLRIFGEFASAAAIATFPGDAAGPNLSQRPLLQGSRTMLLIGVVNENLNQSFGLKLLYFKLPTAVLQTIGGATAFDVFDSGSDFFPFFPDTWIQARALMVTQANQIYSPRESLPYPFTSHPPLVGGKTGFIGGLDKATGGATITLTALKQTLNLYGVIAQPKTDAQRAVLTGFPVRDLQVLDSRTLGPLFQSGPL